MVHQAFVFFIRHVTHDHSKYNLYLIRNIDINKLIVEAVVTSRFTIWNQAVHLLLHFIYMPFVTFYIYTFCYILNEMLQFKFPLTCTCHSGNYYNSDGNQQSCQRGSQIKFIVYTACACRQSHVTIWPDTVIFPLAVWALLK